MTSNVHEFVARTAISHLDFRTRICNEQPPAIVNDVYGVKERMVQLQFFYSKSSLFVGKMQFIVTPINSRKSNSDVYGLICFSMNKRHSTLKLSPLYVTTTGSSDSNGNQVKSHFTLLFNINDLDDHLSHHISFDVAQRNEANPLSKTIYVRLNNELLKSDETHFKATPLMINLDKVELKANDYELDDDRSSVHTSYTGREFYNANLYCDSKSAMN
ncbi:uncharacterized protein ASCRUDRAFT_7975 [Ascoidea rubescens DSM 1968]|uniref:Uncharacterized protein n=1 Tax=Ascoidea rubescens DSM 1968 TaxID=1344418 RepID=A0A1D2VHD6_9ASCO|nr:hypothetical protein ASCRUDRAFT_7975 [Ascoidea rubescens DSM 1968]ODV61002.1 hypothetical protein ASCRUDRAFT_7975 [Ascoidea rubescens DSM 1968]